MKGKMNRRWLAFALAGAMFAESIMPAGATELSMSQDAGIVVSEQTEGQQDVQPEVEQQEVQTEQTEAVETSVKVPTGLKVSELSPVGKDSTKMYLSLLWNKVADCTGYEVYRSTENVAESYQKLEQECPQDTKSRISFVDETGDMGVVYYYKVRAYKDVVNEETPEEAPVRVYSDFSEVVDTRVEVDAFTLNESTLTLNRNGQSQLKVSFKPAYATETQVQWKSSDEKVVTVDNGLVTAVGTGTATVEATIGGLKQTCKVMVIARIENMAFEVPKKELCKGTTDSLSLVITPEDATNCGDIVWTSEDETIATISVSEDKKSAQVTAISTGTTKITATVGDVKAECGVNVIQPIEKISFTKDGKSLSDTLTMQINDNTEQVSIVLTPEDTTDTDLTYVVSRPELITCNLKDRVLSLTPGDEPGETVITVYAGSGDNAKKVERELKVNIVVEKDEVDTTTTLIPVEKVTITGDTKKELLKDEDNYVFGAFNLQMGSETTAETILSAQVSPSNATDKTVQWIAENENVVAVTANEDGTAVMRAVGVGRTYVYAEARNGVKAKIEVTVLSETSEDFLIYEKKVLYCNEELTDSKNTKFAKRYQIKPVMLKEDLLYSYEYLSYNEAVATVDENGLVTAHKPGTAYIQVRCKETGKTKQLTVDVKRAILDFSFPLEEITVQKGSTITIPYQFEPQNASTRCKNTIKVSSSEEQKNISIPKYTNSEIEIKAESEGDAEIIVEAGDDYEGKSKGLTSARKVIIIHVASANKSKVATLKATITGTDKPEMQSGTSRQIDLTIRDKNSIDLNRDKISLIYTSTDPKVASVDSNGVVKALKAGKTTITVKALDGSGKSSQMELKVNQRPTEIRFDQDVYGLTKGTNGTASLTLTPTFVPADTMTNNKAVTWKIVEVGDDTETFPSSEYSRYFQVSDKGCVSVSKYAVNGMYARVRCTSKAYTTQETPVYKDVLVRIQAKRVKSVKFAKSSLQVVGLKDVLLDFTPTYYSNQFGAQFSVTSSDCKIAEAEVAAEGVVTVHPHKYGKVTLTVIADDCKDVKSTMTLTIYPFEKGDIVSSQEIYMLQQYAYNSGDKVQLQFVDSATGKKVVDPTLFTYTSSDSSIIYVDKQGVAHANPNAPKLTEENKTVTVTATLKNDPEQRVVTTQVSLCLKEQVERYDVKYYQTVDDKNKDKNNIKSETYGVYLGEEPVNLLYRAKGQKFALRTILYGADGDNMQTEKLKMSVSDTNIAQVESSGYATKIGSGSDVMYVYDSTIVVNKAGTFSVTMQATGEKETKRTVQFAAVSGKPSLVGNSFGSINKNRVVQDGKIRSVTPFTLYAAEGTEITSVSIDSAKIVYESTPDIEDYIPQSKIYLISSEKNTELAPNEYQIAIDKDVLSRAKAGSYTIKINVSRTAIALENVKGKPLESDEEKETITAKYTIFDTKPSVKEIKGTLSSFYKDAVVKLSIDTNREINNITVDEESQLYKEIEIFRKGNDWYAKLRDEAFAGWKKSSCKGYVNVYFEGFDDEKPSKAKLSLTIDKKTPTIKQKSKPAIHLDYGTTASITLVDANGKAWTDYSVQMKKTAADCKFTVSRQDDGTLKVQMNTSQTLKASTYKEKVIISNPNWRKSVEVTLAVKTYSGKSVPKVDFEKTKVTINRNAQESYVETRLKCSMLNAPLYEGEWKILDSCTYKVGREKHLCSELFTVTNTAGVIRVSLKSGVTVNPGTYSLIMSGIWDDAQYNTQAKKPLQTTTLKVVVSDKVPTATIKLSGSLDTIRRSKSTLKGKVTLSNTNSEVAKIQLGQGLQDNFYCIRKDNTFTIYAKSNAAIKLVKTTGQVKVTLKNGMVLTSTISFVPKQSVPQWANPEKQTIYKSAEVKTVDYDLNENLPEGVHISDIKAVQVPDGLQVQMDNGHVFVTLGNPSLKAGNYTIRVNTYFKGAVATSTNSLGKPVEKIFIVTVAE